MPRKPTSKVETVRFELGSWERTHLAPVIHAQAMDKYSEALGYLLDWKKLYLAVTLIEVATGYEILWGTPNDLGDLVGQVRDWWKANKEAFGDEGLWGYLGLGRTPQTPEEQARIYAQAEVWANAFGITVDPATGAVSEADSPTYTSAGQIWAESFGVSF